MPRISCYPHTITSHNYHLRGDSNQSYIFHDANKNLVFMKISGKDRVCDVLYNIIIYNKSIIIPLACWCQTKMLLALLKLSRIGSTSYRVGTYLWV